MLNSSSLRFPKGQCIVAMVLSDACWGLGTVMSKKVLEYFPPLTLLIVQLVTSIAFLWTIMLVRWQWRRTSFLNQFCLLSPWAMLRLSCLGLLEPGLSYTFYQLGLVMTTASSTSLIVTAEPIMVIGLAWLLLRERIDPSLLALSIVAIIGVTFTVGFDLNLSGSSLIGNLLVAVGTFCAALYVILSRRGVEKIAPLSLAAIEQSVGLAWIIIVWLVMQGYEEVARLTSVSPAIWGWAVASGVVQDALALWFYLIAIKGIPAGIAAQFLALIPVFGVSSAYLFLGERLAMMQGVGMVLILAAVVSIAGLPDSAALKVQPYRRHKNK